MIYRICAFTEKGRKLARELEARLPEHIFEKRDGAEPLDAWTEESFRDRLPMIFIGACGIAVRAIAPQVRDKLTDSPVLVIDERGQFVIPILSGHLGGANRIAEELAQRLGAQAVLTTATDVNGVFSVDVFASDNGLEIVNRDGIRSISSRLLAEGSVTIAWTEDILAEEKDLPQTLSRTAPERADILITGTGKRFDANRIVLRPKIYVLGIGCRKNTAAETIRSACKTILEDSGIPMSDICAAASIDLKAREPGLLRYTAAQGLPLFTYSAKELRETEGSFSHSDFVEKTTGTDNVCERAAVCHAGPEARLILKKQVLNGVTAAVAERKVRITRWTTR